MSACDISKSAIRYSVLFETNDSEQTQSDDCCSGICFCNCCNQVFLLTLFTEQNICDNYSTRIKYFTIQNLSDYSSKHWQPPKV